MAGVDIQKIERLIEEIFDSGHLFQEKEREGRRDLVLVVAVHELMFKCEKERELEVVAIWREVATLARDIEHNSNASVKREI